MEYSPVAVLASAKTAYTGGVVDAHMVAVMMISGQKKIHITRLIQISRHEQHGAIGISQGNKRTGVGAVYYIRSITVINSSNMKVPLWKNA